MGHVAVWMEEAEYIVCASSCDASSPGAFTKARLAEGIFAVYASSEPDVLRYGYTLMTVAFEKPLWTLASAKQWWAGYEARQQRAHRQFSHMTSEMTLIQ